MSQSQEKQETTHFGYKEVPASEKAGKVAEVFHSVADKYDIMNDVMSFGIHRVWKKIAIETVRARPGQRILDLAGGTGDLAAEMSKRVGDTGEIVLGDINASMLSVGRDRLTDKGLIKNIRYVQANAQYLPFPDNHFDCITIAFGLRNVTDKQMALESMFRVLKPGGKLIVLEFSKPVLPGLKSIYDFYSFKILPKMGQLIANDAESYQYLSESIRMHPGQDELKAMMEAAGFDRCDYTNMSGGIVAMHRGYKF